MGNIKILPPNIQNMIAAGEVIERPANVLKELLENSLDAGADEIFAEIEGGGQVLVMVQDNGSGMDKEDLLLAVKRHATSKIRERNDLFAIKSFGFRGEALPSIGSVSHMKICTKKQGADFGYFLEIRYGKQEDLGICALNRGTKVEVRDLFLQVPARLKFLKSTPVESKRCEEVFYKIALCHIDKEFYLKRDGKERFRFSKNEDVLSRIKSIWPQELVDNFRTVDYKIGDVAVLGYVCDPKYSQNRGDRIIFFVNNRPVKDRILLKALKQAYSGMILSKEYPAGILFLKMAPDFVDVNVHPAKMEVRFRDESLVFSAVYRGVKSAIEKKYFESVCPEEKKHHKEKKYLSQALAEYRVEEEKGFDLDIVEKDYVVSHIDIPKDKPIEESDKDVLEFIYLGQIEDTYLIVKDRDGKLIILDQHAAHERILYERYSEKKFRSTQSLLTPIKIKLPRDRDLAFINELNHLGFEYKTVGDHIFISGIPAYLSGGEAEEIIKEYINSDKDSVDSLIKMISCKKAIKANTKLETWEAKELIKQWLRCKNKEFCPHGRPTSLVFSRKELDRMFKR
ncbi:DNA mismatch repair endonuclease MutL [Desulfothermus sp.]